MNISQKDYFLCINVSWDGQLRITPMKPPGGESKLNLKEDDDGEEKEEEQEERCVRWEEKEWECKHLHSLWISFTSFGRAASVSSVTSFAPALGFHLCWVCQSGQKVVSDDLKEKGESRFKSNEWRIGWDQWHGGAWWVSQNCFKLRSWAWEHVVACH